MKTPSFQEGRWRTKKDGKVSAMLNLKNMPDEEFCFVVTPPVSRVAMQVTLDEKGIVALSGKLAEHFSKKTVEIRFNKELSAIQIAHVPGDTAQIVFPKSGRKCIPNAMEFLQQQRLVFPVVFSSYDIPENGKWRGARMENPTPKPSVCSRSTKKK